MFNLIRFLIFFFFLLSIIRIRFVALSILYRPIFHPPLIPRNFPPRVYYIDCFRFIPPEFRSGNLLVIFFFFFRDLPDDLCHPVMADETTHEQARPWLITRCKMTSRSGLLIWRFEKLTAGDGLCFFFF